MTYTTIQSISESQGRSSTSPVGFQTGNAGNTTAILKLIADLMKLFEYKNNAFTTQAQAESKMANYYSESQIALGDQEMTEYVIQGAFSGVNGLMSVGMGIHGVFEESKVASLEKEVNGTQKFIDNLGSQKPDVSINDKAKSFSSQDGGEDIEMQPLGKSLENPDQTTETINKQEVEGRLDEMIEELKSGEYKMTNGKGNAAELKSKKETGKDFSDEEVVATLEEPQMTKLKDAAKERLKSKQDELSSEHSKLRMNFDKRQMWSNAAQGVSSSSGQIGAGVMKKQEADQQADNTQFQTAQQQFQSLSKETEGQADKDLQSAESLTQLIPDLDRSNNAILSA